MPQISRWPEYRTKKIEDGVEKVINLLGIIEHPALENNTELALEAFTDGLTKSELRAFFLAKIKKYEIVMEYQKQEKNPMKVN